MSGEAIRRLWIGVEIKINGNLVSLYDQTIRL